MTTTPTPRRRRLPERQMHALTETTHAACLRDWIAAGLQPGTVVTSENEMASRYGVTLAVARRVLARFESDGVLRREIGRGSVLARLPNAAGDTRVSAARLLLPPWLLQDRSPWLSEYLFSLEAALSSYGLQLCAESTADAEPDARPCAALTYHLQPGAPVLARMAALRPALQVGTHLDGVAAVQFDDTAAGRVAADHLVELGHRSVGFIGYRDVPWAAAQTARLQGLRQADSLLLPAAAVTLDCADPVTPGDLAERLRAWIAAGVSAVVAANDHLAQAVCHAVRGAGLRVPGDLSVMGFDDAHVWRPNGLTTLRFPWAELGATTARALLSGAGMTAADRRVAPQLIRRSTTAARVAP